MKTSSSAPKANGKRLAFLRVLILFVGVMVMLWAVRYFGAEARVRRATVRVIRTVQKDGEESPVFLGLSANQFGRALATNMVLTLADVGILSSSRQETVQLFAQIRNSVDRMTFTDPVIVVKREKSGEVIARVDAQYRFEFSTAADEAVGEGKAALTWTHGKDGWQIQRATLKSETAFPDSELWP